MPSVVLVGGSDHRVMFFTKAWVNSDTLEMRDSILSLLGPTSLAPADESLPSFMVYPNPATDQVTVSLELAQAGNLLVEVLDLDGRQVAVILHEEQPAGAVSRQFNTSGIAAGNYILRAVANGKASQQKISIVH
jgi:hypothetical protein